MNLGCHLGLPSLFVPDQSRKLTICASNEGVSCDIVVVAQRCPAMQFSKLPATFQLQ